jgi:RNA polymerase-interacting CarD/CdnL/TRCF family regulator
VEELLMSKDKIEVNMNIYDIPIVVEELKKADKEIERKDKKIERLKKNNQAMQEELCKVWDERDNAYRRILDAVDNLETPYFKDCEQQCKDVINILKGEDKE